MYQITSTVAVYNYFDRYEYATERTFIYSHKLYVFSLREHKPLQPQCTADHLN